MKHNKNFHYETKIRVFIVKHKQEFLFHSGTKTLVIVSQCSLFRTLHVIYETKNKRERDPSKNEAQNDSLNCEAKNKNFHCETKQVLT